MPKEFSSGIRQKLLPAILSIILFVVAYLLLVSSVLLLSASALYGAYVLICYKFSYITILAAGGLCCVALVLFVFMFKFIFSDSGTDYSSMIKLNRADEPILFNLVESLCNEIHTSKPKEIYLSSDVNASVSFVSNFWSLIFPVRKKLVIGLGLMNCCTEPELKSIIAHELGHFSQKSLHLRSYIYYAVRIMDNMVSNDERYQSFAKSISELHAIISLFVKIALGVVWVIQYLVDKLYKFTTRFHYGLSQEMEYHADSVSTACCGTKSFVTAMVSVNLGTWLFNMLLSRYSDYKETEILTKNIYSQHRLLTSYVAKYYGFTLQDNLPQVSLRNYFSTIQTALELNSKLTTHPSLYRRLKTAGVNDTIIYKREGNMSIEILTNKDIYATTLTETFFSEMRMTYKTHYCSDEEFESQIEFKTKYPEYFLGYFDRTEPICENSEEIDISNLNENDLFNINIVMCWDELAILTINISILEKSRENESVVGVEYLGTDIDNVDELSQKLVAKRNNLIEILNKHSKLIHTYYKQQAIEHGLLTSFEESCKKYYETNQHLNRTLEFVQQFYLDCCFMLEFTKYDTIVERIEQLRPAESHFKKIISEILENPTHKGIIEDNDILKLTQFAEPEFEYFHYTSKVYNEEELELLFSCINIIERWYRTSADINKIEMIAVYVQLHEKQKSQTQRFINTSSPVLTDI